MPNFTLPIRLLLLALVLGGAFLGGRYLAGNQASPAGVPAAATPAGPAATVPTTPVAPVAPSTSSTGVDSTSRMAFTYLPPEPVGGKLRGVVELGASGFNSFIVRTDAENRWKLYKAAYDNSLIMENMASDDDIRRGLRAYIVQMLDYGVSGHDIHFVVSSGAAIAHDTHRIIRNLGSMGYVVNIMTAAREGALGLHVALPPLYADKAFVVDIGSGSTEISWLLAGVPQSVETYGSKYFEQGMDGAMVASDVLTKASQVPLRLRKTCFIIGGVPYELAKRLRKGKERYTVLAAPQAYHIDNAKTKAGLSIYQTIAETTGCQQFVFDWDANFTIGYLLALPQ
ncbi:MAG: hypothetical protein ACRYG7_02125 [Janthinobacterium lividum]